MVMTATYSCAAPVKLLEHINWQHYGYNPRSWKVKLEAMQGVKKMDQELCCYTKETQSFGTSRPYVVQ
ncbi:hypothetical protein C4D60_Mb07t26790 [Musa balbisiana]|uniref:Uncharacterized protein n=1 Tax=Musa balbisiana TaxID=52838 RepID=A0A4S8JIH4_MUSBA|nr:hypothetical protein C4D60_Mb07t26790 [Musa balbisiana]